MLPLFMLRLVGLLLAAWTSVACELGLNVSAKPHLELKRRHLGDALDAAPGLYLAPTSDPWAVVVAVAWAADAALACEAVAKVGVVADLKGLPIGAGAAAAPHASAFGDEVL